MGDATTSFVFALSCGRKNTSADMVEISTMNGMVDVNSYVDWGVISQRLHVRPNMGEDFIEVKAFQFTWREALAINSDSTNQH